ncbi:MAG: SCO family protein [Planctomycetota bacterium]
MNRTKPETLPAVARRGGSLCLGGSSGRGVISFAIVITLTLAASFPARLLGQPAFQSNDQVSLNDGVPREVQGVTLEQNLGAEIPLNLNLTDSEGRKIKTGYVLDGNLPVIITLNYSDCPMLCSVQLNQLCKSLNQLDLKLGTDFQILTVSIDPNEPTQRVAETKKSYVDQVIREHPLANDGWTFATAQQVTIKRLADILGFKYRYDRRTGEYYHPAMLAFISPKGIVSRYSLAMSFEPEDLRKAIIESGEGTVGTIVDQAVLWCFAYDPSSNSYTPQAWKLMRVGGAVTVALTLLALMPYWVGRKNNVALADSTEHPQDPFVN